MKLAAIAGAAALFLSLSAQAQEFTPYRDMPAGTYAVDPNHSQLLWRVMHAGLSNYTARFTDFDASVTFDPADVASSKVVATIEPKSLQTDYDTSSGKDFNKELSEGEQWLNAGKFPQIGFTSTRIEVTGENTGRIHGDLTLLGVTRPVVLEAKFNGAFVSQPFNKKPTLGFSATGSFNRSDWGLATYVPMIGDRIEIIIEAEFIKAE